MDKYDIEELVAKIKHHVENDDATYLLHLRPLLKNLATKHAQGTYNTRHAVAMFEIIAKDSIPRTVREQWGRQVNWPSVLPPAVFRTAAIEWEREFRKEYSHGTYDKLIPPKLRRLRKTT